MKKISILLILFCIVVSCVGCNNSTKPKENNDYTELHISAASSLQEVMVEIEKEFKIENPDIKLTFNLGSSGSLMQQIEQGAPCDIFISASNKEMDKLIEENLIDKDTKDILLTNDLVLISAKGENIDSLEDLQKDKISKIAIGDFNSVPAGKYAKEVLDNANLYNKIKHKLVFGKDVKEVLAWVNQGNAQVGFVYSSDAIKKDNIEVALTTDENLHSSIEYPIAIVKDSKQKESAVEFKEFMLSDKGQAILEKYGFKKVD